MGSTSTRLYWVTPDGDVSACDKRHCFRMGGEHEHYRPGDRRLLVEVKGWRVCPLVCYDLRFPVWSRNTDGYDLLLYVANWPAARRSAWQRLLRARAIENLCHVVGVNTIGTDGRDIAYAGDSAALDWLGDALHDCGDRDETVTVTLDAGGLARYRETFPAHLDADRFRLEVTVG